MNRSLNQHPAGKINWVSHTPVAVVDIDDTLAETTPYMLDELNRRLGTSHALDDLTIYHLWERFPIPRELVIQLIEDQSFQATIPPIRGAADGLWRLRQQGYFIWLITGRPHALDELTEEWLRQWSMPYDKLTLGLAGAEKAEVLQEPIQLAFEDRLDAVAVFSKSAEQVFLFDKPWNRAATLPGHITRINQWDDVGLSLNG